MISYDSRQLELVSQFSGFLALINDPKKFAQAADDAQKTLAAIQEALGKLKTKEQVDAYVDSELAKLDKAKKEFADQQVKANAELDARAKNLAAYDKSLGEKNALLDTKAADLDALAKSLAVQEISVRDRNSYAYQQAKAIDLKIIELNKKEEELAQKLSTVKKMLGE